MNAPRRSARIAAKNGSAPVLPPVPVPAASAVADTVPAPPSLETYVVVEFGCNSSSNDMYAPHISVFYNREDAYKLYDKVKDDIKYMREECDIGYDGYSQSDNESVIQCGDGPHAAKRPIGVIVKRFTNPLPLPQTSPYIVVKLSCDSGHNELNPPSIYLFYNRDDAYARYNEVKGRIIGLKEDKRSNIDYELIDDFKQPDTECIIQSGGEGGAKRPIGAMITKH
jgi:hypothetical protein